MKPAGRKTRGQFEGVLQIVRYNWTLYVVAIIVALSVVGGVVLLRPPAWLAALAVIGAIAAVVWLALSVAVSHYVYDRSDLYRWEWIRDIVRLPAPPGEGRGGGHIVNIHAGLDETSQALQQMYPAAEITILDIYDPAAMPEPSIARARKERHSELASIQADVRRLPLETESADLVAVIFVAHELRAAASRDAFFAEVARVLKPGASLLLIEHLRDGWNLLAFGPGAFHFFPRSEWLRVSERAGLTLSKELRRTAWVRAFVFSRRQSPSQ